MSTELVKSIAAPVALTMPEEERQAVAAAFAENCASGSFTEFDLSQIKVASGTALWLIPTLEGDVTAPAIDGVIVKARDTRVYYPEKDAGNVPPQCSSIDCITGVGDPGGACAACPFADWDSGDNGAQACKQQKQFFMLRGTSVLPEKVTLPPTSLKAIRQFFLRLATQGVQYSECIVRLELEKAKNPQGKEYGKAVPKFLRKLSAAEVACVRDMRKFVDSLTPPRVPVTPAEAAAE
jgi:hypothetical protein